jgi:hypothetical protein
MKLDLPEGVPATEVSLDFLEGMVNRMALSYFKYGRVADGFPGKMHAIKTLLDKVQQYQETGNSEWLLDAANYAMIEFMHPRHPQAHYRATDSAESRGRVAAAGALTHRANTAQQEALRLGRPKRVALRDTIETDASAARAKVRAIEVQSQAPCYGGKFGD